MLHIKKFGLSAAPCMEFEPPSRVDWSQYFKFTACVALHWGHFAETHVVAGIKLWAPYAGPMRDYGFSSQAGSKLWQDAPYNCLLPTDFIVHSKDFPKVQLKRFLVVYRSYACSLCKVIQSGDWMCSDRATALPMKHRLCNTEPPLLLQCQLTHPDRYRLHGSPFCHNPRDVDGPCSMKLFGSARWHQLCDHVLAGNQIGSRTP